MTSRNSFLMLITASLVAAHLAVAQAGPSASPLAAEPSPAISRHVPRLNQEIGQDYFYAGRLSGDGQELVALGSEGKVFRWRVDDLVPLGNVSLEEVPSHPYGIKFSADGKRAAMLRDGVLMLWDMKDGRKLARWLVRRVFSITGGGKFSPPMASAFHPDGTTLVSTGYIGQLHLWDTTALTRTKTLSLNLHDFIRDLAFSADGRRLAIMTTKALQIRDTVNWKVVSQFSYQPSRQSFVALSDNGRLAAVVHRRDVSIFDTSTHKVLKLPHQPGDRFSQERQFNFPIFSHDHKWLAVGNGVIPVDYPLSSQIWIWDTSTGQFKHSFKAGEIPVAVGFTPDDRRFVYLSGSIYFKDVSEILSR